MRSVLAIIMAIGFAGPAFADDYPDMRGTWSGTTESVRIHTSQFYARRDDAVVFSSSAVTLKIGHQEDRRLAGSIEINGWNKPIVGAFTGADTIQWAEPGGVVEARILGPDSLDYCYFRPGEFQQLASCATLKREGGS
jgi:hypothetical protein